MRSIRDWSAAEKDYFFVGRTRAEIEPEISSPFGTFLAHKIDVLTVVFTALRR